jgi:hypothetical protein
MKSSDHGYFATLTYDLRVRERLLAAGVLTPAELERYLGELPELETQAEALGIDQPALGAASAMAAGQSTPTMPTDDSAQDDDAGAA